MYVKVVSLFRPQYVMLYVQVFTCPAANYVLTKALIALC